MCSFTWILLYATVYSQKVQGNIYSTTKETHQSLLRAILENRIKKYKYIYTIFLNNQFCINKLNNVTVLLKSVQGVRQCLDKGSFSKMTSFHWRMNISFSSKSVNLN